MLAKRIIPCLDIKNGKVVKGTNFIDLQDAGDPVALAKRYNAEGADELCFLDINASFENRSTLIGLVKAVAKELFIPFTIGGGISSVAQIKDLLRAGADKVSLNSSAVKNPKLITQAAQIFGSQCVVIAIDAKQVGKDWQVFVKGGREATGLDVIAWAKKVVSLGAGEILLTSMDRDGTKSGFDLELTKAVSEAVSVPVIASGGAGALSDFSEVLTSGKADAVLAASLFHYNQISIADLKDYLFINNINVRRTN